MRRSGKYGEVWVFLSVPMLVFFGLFLAAGFGGLSLAERFWTHGASWDNPPWYFIGQDLVSDLAYSVALAACLIVAFAFRRLYQGASSRWAAFMAVLWTGPHAADAVVILLHTSHVWDPARATTTWRSFHDFIGDPVRHIALASVLVAVLVYTIATRDRREEARAEGSTKDKIEEETGSPAPAGTKEGPA